MRDLEILANAKRASQPTATAIDRQQDSPDGFPIRQKTSWKLLFLVTEDWYFWSHRLSIARAARAAGAEVLVMSHITRYREAMEAEGFNVIDWHVSRGSWNPLREVRPFLEVVRIYRRELPTLVHHVALKPIIHGGVAARLSGGIPSVNAIAGLGHIFIASTWKNQLLCRVLTVFMRWALNTANAKAVFQNRENCELLVGEGIVPHDRAIIIRGVGVNTRTFCPQPEPAGPPVVMLPSRMLWEKGVGEFVSAARSLREQGLAARFVLVGGPDPHNPASIPKTQLQAWVESGVVEWWGHRNDMGAIFAQSSLVCLPSYLEGLPKVLVEAAACGRAIVTTDVPGCRDVVRHGENGFLVPPRDGKALASTLALLLNNKTLRATMGARGREIVVRDFSEECLNEQILAVYRELLTIRSGALLLQVPEPGSPV